VATARSELAETREGELLERQPWGLAGRRQRRILTGLLLECEFIDRVLSGLWAAGMIRRYGTR
jgi:hypothetical protein